MSQLIEGNSLDVLKEFPDNYFSSCITDPPYELGFMGKKWDQSGIAYSQDLWSEVLRVLKPGAYLLSFGGTRTYHRMACAIEDMGFEIRDSIHWCYGSGFPKSLDVSKSFDKENGRHSEYSAFGAYLRERRLAMGLSMSEIDRQLGTNTAYSWWEGRKRGIQPPDKQHYKALKDILNLDDRYDEFIERIEAEREVIGKRDYDAPKELYQIGLDKEGTRTDIDITAPSSPEAIQWAGFGTALKPAHEIIAMARKPLEGRVIDNIRKWGCGGLNIDGSRIGTDDIKTHNTAFLKFQGQNTRPWQECHENFDTSHQGRFPANFILGHSPDCVYRGEKKVKDSHQPGPNGHKNSESLIGMPSGGMTSLYTDPSGHENVADWDCSDSCPVRLLDKQSGISKSPSIGSKLMTGGRKTGVLAESKGIYTPGRVFEATTSYAHGDTGTASRFFKQIDPDPFIYVAKASSSERNGCKHPTIKPLKLIKYLVTLVTPPDGIVLDPFIGSGTLGIACNDLGFDWVGIDLDISFANDRLSQYKKELSKEKNIMEWK